MRVVHFRYHIVARPYDFRHRRYLLLESIQVWHAPRVSILVNCSGPSLKHEQCARLRRRVHIRHRRRLVAFRNVDWLMPGGSTFVIEASAPHKIGRYARNVVRHRRRRFTLAEAGKGCLLRFGVVASCRTGNRSRVPPHVTLPQGVPSTPGASTYTSGPAPIQSYQLQVGGAGNGSGAISGGGISCPTTCSGTYPGGTVVTLTATPSPGSTFVSWGGACTGSGSCVVTMSADQSVQANWAPNPNRGATLRANSVLQPGWYLSSPNGQYTLAMQTDGNLVEYQGGSALWSSNTAGNGGASLTMQGSDGNLVIYSSSGQPLWASGTSGHPGDYLALQDDANVVIYGSDGSPLWVKYYVHHVYGTCADGACGVNERSGPGYTNYPRIGGYYDGNEVDVLCQTTGELVSASDGSTNVWDRLTNGGYVTDMYVDTPNSRRGFSPPIPQC